MAGVIFPHLTNNINQFIKRMDLQQLPASFCAWSKIYSTIKHIKIRNLWRLLFQLNIQAILTHCFSRYHVFNHLVPRCTIMLWRRIAWFPSLLQILLWYIRKNFVEHQVLMDKHQNDSCCGVLVEGGESRQTKGALHSCCCYFINLNRLWRQEDGVLFICLCWWKRSISQLCFGQSGLSIAGISVP